MHSAVLVPLQYWRIRSYIGVFGARFATMASGGLYSFRIMKSTTEGSMADEKNIDVQATSDELNDEALNETSGGFEIHNNYVMWSIKCLDWECGAVDAPIFCLLGRCPEEMLQVRRYKR